MEKPISPAKSNITMTIRVNEAQQQAVKEQSEKKNLSQAWYLMSLVEKDMEQDNAN
jgi:hypothetical protein